MRRSPGILALVAVVLFLASCSREPRTVRVGYMICNSLAESRARFDPLTAYLADATGARFEAVYLDTVDVEEALERGELDLVHTNSTLYITLHHRHGAKVVAAEKQGAFGARTRGTIIARRDAGLATLADLKGRRLIFGPPLAPYGFLAQYVLLQEAGVDPEKDLGYYAFPGGTWQHEKIIYAVLYGAFDAGAAPLIDLELMTAEGKIAPDDFVVLASSPLGPYCTFSAASGFPDEWVDKVRQALLAITPATTAEVAGERLGVFQRAGIDGFEVLADGEYDVLRAWARSAKMPPYEEY